jgi:hypothetical protein
MMPPGGFLAGALGIGFLLLIATACAIAILSVVLKAPDQRASGLQVLSELRQMVRDVLDAFRNWRGPRKPPDGP